MCIFGTAPRDVASCNPSIKHPHQEAAMAKSQLRSNREAKKPKQEKTKPVEGAVLNWAAPKMPKPTRAGAKK
jgi:hypothetical protein